jgi:hypothetical protein
MSGARFVWLAEFVLPITAPDRECNRVRAAVPAATQEGRGCRVSQWLPPTGTLGAFHLNGQDWPSGSVIYRGASEPSLRVDVLSPETPEKFAILVVEET